MNQKIKNMLKSLVGWIYRPIRDYFKTKRLLENANWQR